MKRIFVIALFLPLFYTQLGYFGQFIWQQWRIKEAAQEAWIAAQPDGAFVRLPLAGIEAHGQWEERGREFRLDEHWYDVIRSRTIGDTTWLFCLDDENEERLDRQSEQVIRLNQEHPDKKTGSTYCFSIGDIFCEHLAWSVPTPLADTRQYRSVATRPLPGRSPDVTGPPPKG